MSESNYVATFPVTSPKDTTHSGIRGISFAYELRIKLICATLLNLFYICKGSESNPFYYKCRHNLARMSFCCLFCEVNVSNFYCFCQLDNLLGFCLGRVLKYTFITIAIMVMFIL